MYILRIQYLSISILFANISISTSWEIYIYVNFDPHFSSLKIKAFSLLAKFQIAHRCIPWAFYSNIQENHNAYELISNYSYLINGYTFSEPNRVDDKSLSILNIWYLYKTSTLFDLGDNLSVHVSFLMERSSDLLRITTTVNSK